MFKEKFEKAKAKAKEIWSKYQDEIVLGGALIISAVGGIVYGYEKGYSKGETEGISNGYDIGSNAAFDAIAKVIDGQPIALTRCHPDDASNLIKIIIEKNGNPDAPEEVMSITDENISDYTAGIIIARKDKNNGSQIQA